MIPIGAIVGAVMVLRALNGAKGGNRQPNPYAVDAGYFALSLLLVFPLTLACFAALLGGAWWCAPLVLLGLALFFPWTTARWVFIPLGWTRAAHRFGSLAALSWGADPKGGRVLAGAWALLRAKKPSAEDREWLEQQLEDTCVPTRGAALVASGLLAASRGDLETTRALCRSVSHLDPRIAPRLARKAALEWSLADAAAHGRWREVLELSQHGSGSYSLAAFFRAAARRLLREPRAGRFALVAWWVLARRWWATWPLLKRAWRQTPAPSLLLAMGELVGSSAEPLARALELHAVLARVPPGQEAMVLSLTTEAWEQALSSFTVKDLVAEHAKGLAPGAGARALETLGEQVTEELAAWVLAREVPLYRLEPNGQLFESVEYRARNELLERIEAAAEDVARRVAEQRPLEAEEEWRGFLSLQHQCTRAAAICGPEARRLAFEAVNVPLCNLGAWLFNERGERAIANGMFRWLLSESLEVGGDEDRRRYRNNVGCGP